MDGVLRWLQLVWQNLLACIAALLIICNTLFFGLPVMVLGWCKLASTNLRWQRWWTRPIIALCSSWVCVILLLERSLLGIRWHIDRPDELLPDHSYLVIANHQSMADIPVLMRALHGQVPFLRFFIKAQLRRVPVFGFAWRVADCPFMHRYDKAYLEKNPQAKGQDLVATIESCRRLRDRPAALMNFIEGTRFTTIKHSQQASPFEHLLKPKAGGIALAIRGMEGQLQTLLDVSIYYGEQRHELWDYLAGRIDQIDIRVRAMAIPAEFHNGDYQNDAVFREQFQQWLNQRWLEKDQVLTELKQARLTRDSASY